MATRTAEATFGWVPGLGHAGAAVMVWKGVKRAVSSEAVNVAMSLGRVRRGGSGVW